MNPRSPRSPRAAVACAALPTLAAVMASGCHDPVCGAHRGDELAAHTPEVQRGVHAGDPGAVLHGIAVAMGVVRHTDTTVGQPMVTQGEPAPVTVVPPSPVVQPSVDSTTEVDGSVHRVTFLPQEPPITAPGRVRAVNPGTTRVAPMVGPVMGRRRAVEP